MDLSQFAMEDAEAWSNNPRHRWVYNRLTVAELCGVQSGPAGVEPPGYPVIWKPVINLWGMGRGVEISSRPSKRYRPGFMWSELLRGQHASTDAFVNEGKIAWFAQATAISAGPQRFAAWFLGASDEAGLEAAKAFVSEHLADYCGPLNVETIGGKIIEVHLRLTKDWVAAGGYSEFPNPPKKMLGVPLFDSRPDRIPEWIGLLGDDGDPRHGLLVAEVRT